MFTLLRLLGYILFIALIIILVIKSMSRARCKKCRQPLRKETIHHPSGFQPDPELCMDCNEQLHANQGVADFNNPESML